MDANLWRIYELIKRLEFSFLRAGGGQICETAWKPPLIFWEHTLLIIGNSTKNGLLASRFVAWYQASKIFFSPIEAQSEDLESKQQVKAQQGVPREKRMNHVFLRLQKS